jgi:hypothetical protein
MVDIKRTASASKEAVTAAIEGVLDPGRMVYISTKDNCWSFRDKRNFA